MAKKKTEIVEPMPPTVEEVAGEPEVIEAVEAGEPSPSGPDVVAEVASVSAPGPVVHFADLRAIRKAIDTLVYGCDSQRARQDAAAPAIEVLDRLLGA